MLSLLGLFLVVGSWLGGYMLLTKWRDKNLLTISKHAASTRHSYLLFALILVGFGLVFYYWLMAWFRPNLGLGSDFTVVLTLVIACQVLTGLAPDTIGWPRILHRTAAYTMAVLYLPLAALVILAPRLSRLAEVLCISLGVYMLTSFLVVVVLKKARHNYLKFQALYIVAFQLLILSAAYIK